MGPAAASRLTSREGRRFGLELAAGLLVVGGVAAWRGHAPVACALAAIGALAALAGLAMPRHLGPLRSAWMGLGHALGRVVSPVFFAIVYYVIVTPTGIARRTFGRTPLARDPAAGTYWIPRATRSAEAARASMERYF